MSLIQGVWDGKEQKIPEQDEVVEGLADQLAGSSVTNGAAAASNTTTTSNTTNG
jgi:serine/threonine-protein phosphatase 2B catalytic subunit